MKLMIDIDDKSYFFVKDLVGISCGSRGCYKTIQQNVINAIRFGKPCDKRLAGQWKKATTGRVYQCSYCGNFLDFDGVNCGRGSANYCPNCGREMRCDE